MCSMCACVLSGFSPVWLSAAPQTVARQAPLSTGFSKQECWSGLPSPPLGDLPDPGIEPMSLMSPALAGGFFTARAPWEGSANTGLVAASGSCLFLCFKSYWHSAVLVHFHIIHSCFLAPAAELRSCDRDHMA